MFSKRLWTLVRLSRRLGVRVSLLALLAVVAAVAARPLDPFIPGPLAATFGRQAVVPVLNVLASSMLAVIAFSLSIMVAAQRQVSQQLTPRAQRLLREDTTTQTVLATFLGAFVFALVALILFNAGFYEGGAPVIVFALTAGIMLLVVLAILRWVDHLSRLGSLDATLAQIEGKALAALRLHRERPALGAQPIAPGQIPPGAVPVLARHAGYVKFIDVPTLTRAAEKEAAQVYLAVMPGAWVARDTPLAHVAGGGTHAQSRVAGAVTIGETRSFDQDPRYGVLVLSEIATRALSPGVNDPGTAVDVIHRLERLLTDTSQPEPDGPQPPETSDRLFALPVDYDEIVEDAFAMIARDGADKVEVAGPLLEALERIAVTGPAALTEAARAMSERCLAYADAALPLSSETDALRGRGRG